MSVANFDVGDLVKVAVQYSAAGLAVDPTTVTFKMKSPTPTTTTYLYGTDAELVRASAGLYYVLVSATSAGRWYVRFSSTGTYQSAVEDDFYVRTSQF